MEQVLRVTTHGYNLYAANGLHRRPFLYCRDTSDALADIRELLDEGLTFDAVNGYETFLGSGWGDWLMDGTRDIAFHLVIDCWNPGGVRKSFPHIIVLTPKK